METTMRSVRIGPSFFSRAFHDYGDWHQAYIREALQNCMDAPGSNKIAITIAETDEVTIVTFCNNGASMDEDTLCNKLLALGESGKRFEGSIGGFGKAKEILMFCHLSWEVWTGDLYVSGIGGDYSFTYGANYEGTKTQVVMDGYQRYYLLEACKQFARTANWAGELMVNGDILDTNYSSGEYRRELKFGKVYTNDTYPNKLICRINGIPMYDTYTAHDEAVVIELTDSLVLNSNRDSLKWEFQRQLDEFVSELAVESKALKDQTENRVIHFPGYKLTGRVGEAIKMEASPQLLETLISTVAALHAPLTATVKYIHPDFYIRSEVPATIPEEFMPETFSDTSKQLMALWVGLLIELATLTGYDGEFSVGFVFDPNSGAIHEQKDDEHIMLVNPATITNIGGNYTITPIWKSTPENNGRLLAVAIHEFVHLQGYSRHNETYATQLTLLTGLVLANMDKFVRYFDN